MTARLPDRARAARAVEEFLRALGAPLDTDPELAGTPVRVAEAFAHDLLTGYDADPARILGSPMEATSNGLVAVVDISVVVTCPHHLMPATGVVHVGYVPNRSIVGFGALAELCRAFAQRLTLQETVARDVVSALMTHLGAKGAGCVVHLRPTCLRIRGGDLRAARAATSAYAGVLDTDAALRYEFLQRIPYGPAFDEPREDDHGTNAR